MGRGRLEVERERVVWRERGGGEEKEANLVEGREGEGREVEYPVGWIDLGQRRGVHRVGSLREDEAEHGGGGKILGLGFGARTESQRHEVYERKF